MMNQEGGAGKKQIQFIGCYWLAGAIEDSVGKGLAIDRFEISQARPVIK
jgi:hypothetical protein